MHLLFEMAYLVHLILVPLAPIFFTTAVDLDRYQRKCTRVVCYYSSWARFRPDPMMFYPRHINVSYCTHIIFAFATVKDNNLATMNEKDEEIYEEFNDLKAQRPDLKTMLSVGGWFMPADGFIAIASSASNRKKFAKNSAAFLRKWKFDGLELDWEFPGTPSNSSMDKQRFTLLLQDLKDEFEMEAKTVKNQALLLSAVVSAQKDIIDRGYDVKKITGIVDFVSMLTFDYHGWWENVTGYSAPLWKNANFDRADAIRTASFSTLYWLYQGGSFNSVVLGLSLHARTFSLKSSQGEVGTGVPVNGPGIPGNYTRDPGFLAYYEVCRFAKIDKHTHYDRVSEAPYVIADDQWMSFESPVSLAAKIYFERYMPYGGVAIWSLDLDDFKGCSCSEGRFPLVSTISNSCDMTKSLSSKGKSDSPVYDNDVAATQERNLPTEICTNKQNGILEVPGDSSMFVSCAQGEAYLQSCGARNRHSPSASLCQEDTNSTLAPTTSGQGTTVFGRRQGVSVLVINLMIVCWVLVI